MSGLGILYYNGCSKNCSMAYIVVQFSGSDFPWTRKEIFIMAINNLPRRNYHLKKSPNAAILNTVVILTMMVLTGITLVTYLDAGRFIPNLHNPLLIVIIGLAVIAYYIKVPPPYVELGGDIVKVKKYIIGGWKTASLKNLQAATVRGNSLHLLFDDEREREIEIKLNAMNFTDAQELQELLNIITSE